MLPVLYIVIPCYNEQEVLPITAPQFLAQLENMMLQNKISPDSRILFVDDGSKDTTWGIISGLARQDERFRGLRLSRNRGHQNALFAGLMEAKDRCDITVSIDCDGQDDISAMEAMVDAYADGNDIVYGVRNDRKSDTFSKRASAQSYYKLLAMLGVEVVYNHADYRLLSRRALEALSEFDEVNLFLRGLIPLVGFQSTAVAYRRTPRKAGKTHYSLGKMLTLAMDGITSLSVKPLRMITTFGILVALVSFIGTIWAMVRYFMGATVSGWASTVCILCFLSGVQLICTGIVGEYIGKIYMEVKHRPRYIIAQRAGKEQPDGED